MSFGIVEVITLLLGLAGFGLQPNPKAPSPDVALQYALPDADVVIHVDALSIVPGNYKALTQLADQPQIKASPELARMVRQAVNQVEGGRGLLKTASGIDLTTDVYDATMFVQYVGPNKDPNFVAALRGKFSTANVDKIAGMSGKQATRVGGGAMIEVAPNDPAIGVTKDGVLLAGTPKLVRDRLADTWKAPARAPSSNLAHVASVLEAKPVMAVVMTLSAAARKDVVGKMDQKKNFMADVITRHKLAAFSVHRDGIGWSWIDSSRAGLDNMALVSEGMLELLRAANIAPRGFAKVALGAIDSYRGSDKRIDEVIRRKADIMKLVQTYTGDGNFKQTINKDVARLRLDVRASGKTLSEVLPAGALIPLGAFAWLGAARKAPMTAPPPSQTGPRPAPPTRTTPPAQPRPVPAQKQPVQPTRP